jgi:hypothetical protein
MAEGGGQKDAKGQNSPYSKFYADSDHQLDIRTKAHIDAPEIKAALPRARKGEDVVSDQELTALTGADSRVYRPDPFAPAPPSYKDDFTGLLTVIDNKVLSGKWTPADQAAQDKQIHDIAVKTGLDENQVQAMAKDYETNAAEGNKTVGDFFAHGERTPLKVEIGDTLRKKALGQEVTPEEETKLQANLATFAKEERYAPSAVQDEINNFTDRVKNGISSRRDDTVDSYNESAQGIHNGRGEAFVYDHGPMDKNRAAVPKIESNDERARLAAWYVNPDDPPKKMPPGGKELGEFLISLHESEHISRKGDDIAKKNLPASVREQAGEIDADKAVIQYLSNAHDKAAKDYWLQARHVDSFTSGVVSGDASHDTATFLREQEKTGKQIDIQQFEREKGDLLRRIQEKADLPAISDYGRARTADVMGAVQAVLAEDKTTKDPSKKLSPMQRAEAQSFLKDAEAMGYKANKDFPKPKVAKDTPPAAKPGPGAPTAPKAS